MSQDERAAIDRTIAYYRARVPEYDEWYRREGRYDRGAAHRRAWRDELQRVERRLRAEGPREHALELACGTGYWTRVLAQIAQRVTAVDASPEAILRNREGVGSDRVSYVVADLYDQTPAPVHDLVFFGFWLSHVPPARFEAFWERVAGALAPGGRVFFVDSALTPESTARDHTIDDPARGTVRRRLNDGREFEIVKVFHEPAVLEARLRSLGWHGRVVATPTFFIHGALERTAQPVQ